MDCCTITQQMDIPTGTEKIVLAGNPNVGKSIFFNYLTGLYVSVSNYPGTTLEISSGSYRDYAVFDTPGVYGVSSFNDEEKVARDVIISADIVINIVDAVHLERDLFLTQQIIDMGKPVVVALNMMDEAVENGLDIDVKLLSEFLGVPVIETVATSGKGLDTVSESISLARRGNNSLQENQEIYSEFNHLTDEIKDRAEGLLIMEGDSFVAEKNGREPLNYREEIYRIRRRRINKIIDRVVSISQENVNIKTRLGNLMLNPLTGIPLLVVALYLLYQFVGVFIAQTIVGFTEETIFINIYEPFIRNIVNRFIEPGSLFGRLLIGEYGLLTMTVTYALGLLLPLVTGFYFFLSIMEDSGYMPRIAALTDRVLTFLGLNGRAIIPMLLGFGCVTMATITTRLLGSNRERIIAIFLLGLAIPCSAQLGVIAGLIAPLGYKYFIIYIITILAVYIIAGTGLNAVLPGQSTDLLIDLPPLRVPRLKNVFIKTYLKAKSFIIEAGPIFAIGSLLLTVLKETGLLRLLQNWLLPITNWLQLPQDVSTAFIMGIVRRDFGAAGLNSMSLTPEQTTVALITLTLFVPCIAAMMIMVKERNWRDAVYIWFGSWITAFTVGGIVAHII